MSVFYVRQKKTYKQERNGGYLWSPKLNRANHKNVGYSTMPYIHKGDFIFHNVNGKILSVSIAQSDCYDSNKPDEFANIDWNKDGYRVDAKYFDLVTPLVVSDYADWLAAHYDEHSAFLKTGGGKQQYMCFLADQHAIYFLELALNQHNSPELKDVLSGMLDEIAGDKDSEYDPVEKELINELVEDSDVQSKPQWPGIREEQALTHSEKTGKDIPKRDPHRAADALARAEYCCEYNPSDPTFLRKNGKPYTEPHHLIPLSKYRDFNNSVDIMENIVSLCSNCHNLLHYGRLEDKIPILKKLYDERIDALRKCGIDLTFEQLKSYYK